LRQYSVCRLLVKESEREEHRGFDEYKKASVLQVEKDMNDVSRFMVSIYYFT
jgi:hypothetical protein